MAERFCHCWGGQITRLYQILRLPLVRRPEFSREELEALVVVFDAVGEVIDAAEKQLAAGEPARAIELLAGLRMPVPAGLPDASGGTAGRMARK